MKTPTVLKTVLWGVIPLLVAAFTLLLAPTAATAASLTEVTSFGANPSQLKMYVYLPANRPARPAVVVAVHYCHGDAVAFYNGSDFARLADQYGFIVIYPSVTQASDGCFDVASAATLQHNGGSDSLGIASMVRYALTTYDADPARVFATGVSSGAMMTNVLLGAYPDLFKAGSAFAGVPFACFAGPNSWNGECASGLISKTPQQWGDLVRAAYPGFTGTRPRMQLWHGTADTVLHYNNFGEEIKQWTNVFGLSQTPTSTDTPQSGWTRTRYASGSTVALEAVSMQGVSHNLPVQAAAAIAFFGLNTATSPSPSPSASASRSPSPSASPSPAGTRACTATFTPASVWAGGFVGAVKVTAGSTAISAWRVTLTLPSGDTVSNSWNGQFSAVSGAIAVTNLPYNGALGAGATTEFGFQSSGTPTGTTATCTAT
ncbi:poly(hydroxyalkanoate) depolymerase family esterase [Allocatelliglobosispora scoriae]|uniref:Poly(Hydroxyalkanoate) depolymerase family esterase n=1 Tax=Allocatelliglobosispora scoriae TaxID=643052 RepID=A0A841BQ67_9ACTN|nr:PHB depolymerase family esterase [Allocatelliglobosispora scoriae]MBB5868902.1 poly(hydroxyalkanoate) depolymerase family esterase [Allocatelliglobosispora scoriae]